VNLTRINSIARQTHLAVLFLSLLGVPYVAGAPLVQLWAQDGSTTRGKTLPSSARCGVSGHAEGQLVLGLAAGHAGYKTSH